MPNRLHRRAERAGLALLAACAWPALVAAQAAPVNAPDRQAAAEAPLRTFDLARPVDPAAVVTPPAASLLPARHLPDARDTLRTMVGVGYVQGADWGSEVVAGGGFAGAQIQANALVTHGSKGLVFDHGSLMVFDPEAKWRVDAGDVFSNLRGAAIGGRVSWRAAGDRRPSIALYAPYGDGDPRSTVLAYRDQWVLKGQTLVDAELATDRSWFLRSRVALSRMEIEASYRTQTTPRRLEDGSLSGSVGLGRGFTISAGAFRTFAGSDPTEWNSVAVRVPLGRHMDVTIERAFAGSELSAQSTYAAMASVTAGNLRAFHRHQFGAYDFVGSASVSTIERQQSQSMTSYTIGRRVNFTLQLATQRAENGQVRHWEELHSSFRLSRTTSLRTVTAIPDFRAGDRFQAYLRQELPSGFSFQADYGHPSAYQPIARTADQPRLKVMVFKSVNIATPARGAEVRGVVKDNTGRGVIGARVKLGPYSTDTDASGGYVFRHVPRGEYALSLDPDLLPADFAWDGRGASLAARPGARIDADLSVTPLNALHGRIYVDRDNNGRYDQGEGVAGAVVQLDARLTAADQDGAYSFFNVWPDTYTIRLHRLPTDLQPGPVSERVVTLVDGRPVTGADFVVVPRMKPILWEGGTR